jgi:hypothetical protein
MNFAWLSRVPKDAIRVSGFGLVLSGKL